MLISCAIVVCARSIELNINIVAVADQLIMTVALQLMRCNCAVMSSL